MALILNNEVVLRDERHFHPDFLCYRNIPSYRTTFVSPAAFDLLKAWTHPLTVEEARVLFTDSARTHGESVIGGEFDAFVDQLVSEETLEQASVGDYHSEPLWGLDYSVPNTPVRPMRFPSKINLTLTEGCNLRCLHCLRNASPEVDTSQDLTTPELANLFDQFNRGGLIALAISGGETTVRQDIIDIIDLLHMVRAHTEFFTNGHRLTPAIRTGLVSLLARKRRGMHVHVSLDGGTEESHDWLRDRHGSFRRVLQSVEALVSDGHLIILESVLTPRNLDTIPELFEMAKHLGVRGLSLHPASFTGRAKVNPVSLKQGDLLVAEQLIQHLAEQYQENFKTEFKWQFFPHPANDKTERAFLASNVSEAGMFHLGLQSDGSVYPCTETIGSDGLTIGNIREQSLQDIWHSGRWDFYRGGWRLEQLSGCRGCRLDGNCATQACRCYAFSTIGNHYAPMPECYQSAAELGIGGGPTDVVRV